MSEWTLEDRFWNKKHTLECFIMKCTYGGLTTLGAEHHYTAYVALPKGHRYYGRDYEKIRLDVHGGFTYSRDYLILSDDKENRIKDSRWFIGWDYAHAWDKNITFKQVLIDCLAIIKKLERGIEKHE
jgi:hypothetical protein